MIEEILPADVVTAEAREDCVEARLFPEEEQFVSKAVDRRRHEFATGRACARTALAQIALPATAIPMGTHGEPSWPAGVVGSITHCSGYRGCAVARSCDVLALGIDAELSAPLPKGLVDDIAHLDELRALHGLWLEAPGVHWDRLLFCAKEATYKVWFPLARSWLGFEDASVAFDRHANVFTTCLTPKELPAGLPCVLSGRWLVRDGLILTAIAIRAEQKAPTTS